jgi:hypothetical protein
MSHSIYIFRLPLINLKRRAIKSISKWLTGNRLCCVLFLLAGVPLNTHALENYVSGFASIGAGHVSEDKVYFGDYENDWSFNTDTVLGLQLQTSLAERWSLTTQVIAKGHNYDDVSKYEPELDWLFLSYEISPEVRTRFGRMRTPFFLYSETMEVGYTYVWVRPPIDVYTPLLSPFKSFDGIDFNFNTDIDLFNLDQAMELETRLFTGVMDGFFLDNDIDVEPAIGLSLRASYQDTTFRYSFVGLRATIDNDTLTPLLSALESIEPLSPSLASTADGFSADQEWYQYHGIGFAQDWHNWSFIAEHYYIFGSDSGLSNDARGYYLSLAYQYKAITPYVVFGRYKNRLNNDVNTDYNNSFSEIPQGINPTIDSLRTQTKTLIEEFNVKEYTYTLGMRWDVIPNVAVKAEYQSFHFADDSSGHMLPFDGNDKASHASLITFVVDMVF